MTKTISLLSILKSLFLTGLLMLILTMPDMAVAGPSEWVDADAPIATEDQGGRTALALLDYSLGLNNNNNCLTCSFIQQFLVALTSFSAAVFMYFRAFFVAILPLVMAIWIAWSVGRIMITGASDGRDFALSVIRKSTLFFFLWIVMIIDTGSTSTDPTETMTITTPQDPWAWFGPNALEYGFQLGNEVRNITAGSLTLTGVGSGGSESLEQQVGFNCEDIADLNPQLASDPDAYGFAYQASEVSCAVERTHMVGIAAGLAMIEGAWSQIVAPSVWSPSSFGAFFGSFLNAIILTIIGMCMIIVFALSAIWFIFLVLDIVVKVLIIAAVSPLLMIFALLQPTRQYAWQAVKGTIGALVTALGLAIVASLAFYLVINISNVYNTANNIYDPGLVDINAGNGVAGLREFIYRMQIDNPQDPELIPMNLTTPWFHYMILVSLAIFALGKKIISMIESIIGAQAMSEMADNAKKLAVLGGAMGIAGAYTGLNVAKTGMAVGTQGVGLGAGVLGAGSNQIGKLAGSASDRLGTASSWLIKGTNPFGAAARDARMRRGGGLGTLERGGRMKDRAQRMAEEMTDDGVR